MSKRFIPYVSSLIVASCTTILIHQLKANLLPQFQTSSFRKKDHEEDDETVSASEMTPHILVPQIQATVSKLRAWDVELSKFYLVFIRFWYKALPLIDTLLWIQTNRQSHKFHRSLVEEIGRNEQLKASLHKITPCDHEHGENDSVSSLCETECSTSSSSSSSSTSISSSSSTSSSTYSSFLQLDDSLRIRADSEMTSTTFSESEPIHIFCMDGGGSKGYALLAMAEAIEDLCHEFHQGNFVSRFDLVAGTSVGGIAALAFSHADSTRECMERCRKHMDFASQTVFTEFSILRLLATGCGMRRNNDMRTVSKLLYGESHLLDNKREIKSFALSAACDDIEGYCYDSNKDHNNTCDTTVEPYLLRSYIHPHDEEEMKDHEEDSSTQTHSYQNGTSQIKLWEAMAATSAIPGGFDRVKVNVNGKSKVLADGSVCCNCPVSVALKEAQSIWPNRPIGVVLSFGLDNLQSNFAETAIESVRLNHPQLHYERIMIPDVDRLKSLETDKNRIREIEDCVRRYMNSEDMRMRMRSVLDKLHCQADHSDCV